MSVSGWGQVAFKWGRLAQKRREQRRGVSPAAVRNSQCKDPQVEISLVPSNINKRDHPTEQDEQEEKGRKWGPPIWRTELRRLTNMKGTLPQVSPGARYWGATVRSSVPAARSGQPFRGLCYQRRGTKSLTKFLALIRPRLEGVRVSAVHNLALLSHTNCLGVSGALCANTPPPLPPPRESGEPSCPWDAWWPPKSGECSPQVISPALW